MLRESQKRTANKWQKFKSKNVQNETEVDAGWDDKQTFDLQNHDSKTYKEDCLLNAQVFKNLKSGEFVAIQTATQVKTTVFLPY